MNELFVIAGHFVDPKTIENIAPLGNGLINDTYKIIVNGQPKYVLQRINNAVFKDVEMLQNNIEAVTNHIRQKYENQGVKDINRRVLHFLKADIGKTYVYENEKYIFLINPDNVEEQYYALIELVEDDINVNIIDNKEPENREIIDVLSNKFREDMFIYLNKVMEAK